MGFGCVITDKTILFFGQKVRTIVWYCNHVLLKTKLVIERQDHIIFWSKSAHHSMVLQPCIIGNHKLIYRYMTYSYEFHVQGTSNVNDVEQVLNRRCT